MKALIQAVKARLATVPDFKTIRVFNNQFELLESGEYEGVFCNAAFIEIINDQPAIQLGRGYQLFDPIIVRIHIGHEFYDGDNMDEDLDVFDLKDKVYQVLQKFEPDGAVAFCRTAEGQDYDHANVYHYIMDFTTNYIDGLMKEPVNGVQSIPPTELVLNASLNIPAKTAKLLTENGFSLITESGDHLNF